VPNEAVVPQRAAKPVPVRSHGLQGAAA